MTKKEKQIIKVLEAMRDNKYQIAKSYTKGSNEYTKYMRSVMAYDNAINMIKSKKDLKDYAEIYEVELE